MYSGTTLRVKSGRLVGVHQRIDRLAYRNLKLKLANDQFFPDIKQILHFEGKNGPDGIKQKQPAKDEPWHYINPANPDDTSLYTMIADHQHNLVTALKAKDESRAAFESAWLAHAITDGLTPAHHYPFEDKLVELRGGASIETRTSIIKKNLMPGDSLFEMISNNWEYWGAKGVMTTHFLFEYGTAMAIAGRKFDKHLTDDEYFKLLVDMPIDQVFKEALARIDELQIYQQFTRTGWTRSLTTKTNQVMMPTIIMTVMVAWAQAADRAHS